MLKERLDHDDRINLQAVIVTGYSFRVIAKILNTSYSTICRINATTIFKNKSQGDETC